MIKPVSSMVKYPNLYRDESKKLEDSEEPDTIVFTEPDKMPTEEEEPEVDIIEEY